MKNFSQFNLGIVLLFATTSLLTSCQKENDELSMSKSLSKLEGRTNQNSIVYPPTSHPFGKSYGEWGFAWWQWAFGFDCATNPITDTDGSLQDQNQSGPVFFLAGSLGTTEVRSVTIPAGKAVFFPMTCYINDYPCPDPSFQPAPGQSLEDFLAAGADAFVSSTTSLSATLDGTTLTNLTDYRGTAGLGSLTGNPDLSNCLDGCVTGSPQPAVSDGYWIMLKPLSAGTHTLHFSASSSWGFTLDVTYNMTVQ